MSATAQQATALKNLKSTLLISLGQICDDKCTIVLDKKILYTIKSKNITINMHKKDIIMKGTRNHKDGLYDIPIKKTVMQEKIFVIPKLKTIPSLNFLSSRKTLSDVKNYKSIFSTKKQKPTVNNMAVKTCNNIVELINLKVNKKFIPVQLFPKLNIILRKNKPKEERVRFLHGDICSPVSSTLIKAIDKNNFTTWPYLTSKQMGKHFPPVIATEAGHIKQERQGL